MAAPVPASTGTYLTGGSTTAAAAAVPSGVTAGDVILVFIYKENAETITPPSGFTQVANSPVATTGTVTQQSVWWRRATGADSGTYSFTWTTAAWREAVAVRFTGCITSGDPTEIDNFAQVSTSDTISPAVSGTTTGVDRLLVWGSTNFNGGFITSPAGFTGQAGAAAGISASAGCSTAAQSAAGSTGSVTGTWTSSSLLTASLTALIPAVVDSLRLPIQTIQVP